MDWNVILTSVVVSGVVSSATAIIVAKMNNRAKRNDTRYAKLYEFFLEIQAYPKPKLALDGFTEEQISEDMEYYNYIQAKYDLLKPLLSQKFQAEVEKVHAKEAEITIAVMKSYFKTKENESETYLGDPKDVSKMLSARIDFERKVIDVIQKQLSLLN